APARIARIVDEVVIREHAAAQRQQDQPAATHARATSKRRAGRTSSLRAWLRAGGNCCRRLPVVASASRGVRRHARHVTRSLLVLLALTGCVDFDEPHRVLISDSATNVTDGPLGKIYGELAAPYSGGLVSGPVTGFTISGTYPNPWGVGPDASLAGTG